MVYFYSIPSSNWSRNLLNFHEEIVDIENKQCDSFTAAMTSVPPLRSHAWNLTPSSVVHILQQQLPKHHKVRDIAQSVYIWASTQPPSLPCYPKHITFPRAFYNKVTNENDNKETRKGHCKSGGI